MSVQYKTNRVLRKKCVADGDYQQTKGVRSERRIPTGKIQGFRKFDKVSYNGEDYFIKGRMTTGYVRLMDIFGNEYGEKATNVKMTKLTKISARKTWVVQLTPMIS